MSTDLHRIARMAWARVTELGHDPVTSIHRALQQAAGAEPVPLAIDRLSPLRRRIAMVLLDAPGIDCKRVAQEVGTSSGCVSSQLRKMKANGLVQRLSKGRYQMADLHGRAPGAPDPAREACVLGRYRVLTSAKLQQLQGGSRAAARGRLNRLTCAGLLRRVAPGQYRSITTTKGQ